jgi:hypothetical protein
MIEIEARCVLTYELFRAFSASGRDEDIVSWADGPGCYISRRWR